MNTRIIFDNYTKLELVGVGLYDDIITAIDEKYYDEGLKDIPIADFDEESDGERQVPINGGEHWTPAIVFIETY